MGESHVRTDHGRAMAAQCAAQCRAMLDNAADSLPIEFDPLGRAWNVDMQPTERFFWLRAAHLHHSNAELAWADLPPDNRLKLRETVKRIGSRALALGEAAS